MNIANGDVAASTMLCKVKRGNQREAPFLQMPAPRFPVDGNNLWHLREVILQPPLSLAQRG